MNAVVFCGPTIRAEEARRHLDADYRPPAALGDVFRAVRDGHRLVGLVDGYFERVPATWHKEILWALSEGAHVWGAASMGALRAAELAPFGMVGVGGIYEEYEAGVLEDDDEVAVAHAMGDDFRATSLAMVDIRATLGRAEVEGVVSAAARVALEDRAKGLFYAERTWVEVLVHDRVPAAERAALSRWLPHGLVGRKRADAVELLDAMGRFLADRPGPHRARFSFERTSFWEEAVAEIDGDVDPNGTFVPTERILDELTLDADHYLRLRHRALSRAGTPSLSGPWLRRAIVDLLRRDPAHDAIRGRAARKTATLGSVGWSEVTYDDLRLDRARLIRWWFEEVHGRGTPPDLGRYAARLDLGEVTFLRVLRREYAFRRPTSPVGVSNSGADPP